MKKKFDAEGRKWNKCYLLFLGIGCSIVAVVILGWLIKQHNGISSESQQPQSLKVLTAQRDIKAGEFADESLFSLTELEIDAVSIPEDAVKNFDALKGQRIAVPLNRNDILIFSDLVNKNNWFESKDRFVEHQFPDGAVPTILPDGNIVGKYIDIMLFREGSPDDVVVSKTVVVSADGNKLGFYLDAVEMENLKEAAIIGNFYIVAYIYDSQEERLVTYHLNE